MLNNADDLQLLIERLYPKNPPAPFALLAAAKRVINGENAGIVARDSHTTRKRLESLVAATDPIMNVFGCNLASAATGESLPRPRDMIGQLLLGELAERSFVDIYRDTMGTDELILEDDRSSRTHRGSPASALSRSASLPRCLRPACQSPSWHRLHLSGRR